MAALKVFNVDAGQDNHKTRLAIRDLLTNVAHLCDQSQLNLADILTAATNLYLEENPKGQQLTKESTTVLDQLRVLADLMDGAHDSHIWDIDNGDQHPQNGCEYCNAVKSARNLIAIHRDAATVPYVLVTVVGGVAEVAINTSGAGVDVLDYDNLKADHSLFKRLSDQERAFLAAHDADLYAQLEAESQVNSLEP
jgi:hypothetical protein